MAERRRARAGRRRRARGAWARRLWRMVRRTLLGLVVLSLAVPPLGVILFALVPVPLTPLMVIRMAEGEGILRIRVPLDAVSPALIEAVIAAEDTRFCAHRGFDVEAIREARRHNAEGGGLRGASTISMQTAKNVFLWPGRDWVRKAIEAYTTLFLETFWSKRRILETYLNIVEWGPGIYGAEAAARYHFQKRAADLSAGEAARLAVILPDPRDLKVAPPGRYVSERARVILQRMAVVRDGGLTRCAGR